MKKILHDFDTNRANIIIETDNSCFDARVESLCDIGFGPGRFAKAASLIREQGACIYGLSRVAIAGDGTLIGACRIWPIIDTHKAHAYFLGPIVVDDKYRSLGLGARLVRETVEACLGNANLPIYLVGDLSFFGQFGFEIVSQGQIILPAATANNRILYLRPKSSVALEGIVKSTFKEFA